MFGGGRANGRMRLGRLGSSALTMSWPLFSRPLRLLVKSSTARDCCLVVVSFRTRACILAVGIIVAKTRITNGWMRVEPLCRSVQDRSCRFKKRGGLKDDGGSTRKYKRDNKYGRKTDESIRHNAARASRFLGSRMKRET